MKELFNRELSWLSFNERVLQESLDKNVPLVERLRFLGIYSNNMDEFFRVRVANISRMIDLGTNKIEGYKGGPKSLLNEIQKTIKQQRRIYDLSYQRLLIEMETNHIFHLNETSVLPSLKKELQVYFEQDLRQDIVPIMLDNARKFPRLLDKEIYLAVKISHGKKLKTRYALIQIPSNHKRFKTFEEGGKRYVIIVDDIIRMFLTQIFSIFTFDQVEAYTFKFTRDAELNIDDDISIPMFEKMEEGIKQRKKGDPLRFVYDENMPVDLLDFLKSGIGVSKFDHIAPSGRYHNFKDLMGFPDFGRPDFVFDPLPPLPHPVFGSANSLLKTVLEKDVLLHYPYHKFDHTVDFLREAAIDPKVKEIKIVIYRVAKRSQIINALINAVKNGKEVTVVVELQARFDEENNMYWSSLLREHGAKIIYGVPGLKVHAKLIQVTRYSGKKEQLIVHVGTGNFHGVTAKIYTDFSLFTARLEITKEVKKVFNLLENNIERGIYRHLMVSPFNTRRKFIALINKEIKNVKLGGDGKISIKINNLVDPGLISKLYDAASKGVEIKIIVRGVCCMEPQPNIEIISIVGRFLEHTRFFVFHDNGEELMFLSSADWMQRNLDKRIEVTVPIYDENIKIELKRIFELQWSDNVKARYIDKFQKNKYVKAALDEVQLNTQEAIYSLYESGELYGFEPTESHKKQPI